MNTKCIIVYETENAICELMISVVEKKPVHSITQMPSKSSLALIEALKAKHNGNIEAVWDELDRVCVEVLGYPLSQKYREAKIDL